METLTNISLLHQGIDASWLPDSPASLNIIISGNHCVATVFDKDQQKYVLLKSFYSADGMSGFTNPEWLKENIPYISELTPNFSFSFPKTTLVPDALFNDSIKRDFLQLNYVLTEEENISSTYLKHIKAHLVYAYEPKALDYLRKIFPECTISHSSAGWLESLSLFHKNDDASHIHIDVEGDKIDICYFSEGTLQLFNTFICQTDEDRLYYPLFISEQLRINTQKDNYYLSGFLDKESSMHKLFGKYIKNLKFEESPSQFRYSLPVMTLPSHMYIKSFCTPLCA